MENAETHSTKDESVVGGNIIFEIWLQIQGKYEIARTNFEGLYSTSIFQTLFFLLKNSLPKLQRKQICTAVRYIQINQISVLMCWAEIW